MLCPLFSVFLVGHLVPLKTIGADVDEAEG